MTVQEFVNEYACSLGKEKAKDVVRAFRDRLPEDERPYWPRKRVLAELRKAGVAIGKDRKSVAVVGGLDLGKRRWRVVDGRLKLVPA